MKVMGHRGVAGLALENSLDGFKLADILGLEAVELDVHLTKDNILVVIHDSNLARLSDKNISIKSTNYSDIKKVRLIDGKSYVPTLEEVVKLLKDTHLIIEIKPTGCIKQIDNFIKKHPNQKITIVSFKHNELIKLRKINSEVEIYATERTKPFEIIQFAKNNKLNGIFLNYWLLNPLTYMLAKKLNLGIFVYTVNSPIIANIISVLYPQVTICTDFPDKFVKPKNIK